MSSRIVEGVALPLPVAGQPALDFCNTRAGWNAEHPKEYLVSVRALWLWCREAGLLSEPPLVGPPAAGSRPAAGRRPGADGVDVLRRAVALRDALYPIALGGGTDAGWKLISAEATAARTVSVLRPGVPARWQLLAAGVDAPVLAVAAAAADLLTGPLAGSVDACPGVGCGWLFADPRGRRRWCSMAVCGNRAKARRHRTGVSSPIIGRTPSGPAA